MSTLLYNPFDAKSVLLAAIVKMTNKDIDNGLINNDSNVLSITENYNSKDNIIGCLLPSSLNIKCSSEVSSLNEQLVDNFEFITGYRDIQNIFNGLNSYGINIHQLSSNYFMLVNAFKYLNGQDEIMSVDMPFDKHAVNDSLRRIKSYISKNSTTMHDILVTSVPAGADYYLAKRLFTIATTQYINLYMSVRGVFIDSNIHPDIVKQLDISTEAFYI